MLSINLFLVLIDLLIIDINLIENNSNSQIIKVLDFTNLFILSLLGLIPKHYKRFQIIYHFLYQKKCLVNKYI